MIVEAVQCNEPKTVATDLGFINANRGDWLICGEGGESYIVDDAFFQQAFVSLQINVQTAAEEKPERQIRDARDGDRIRSRTSINRVRLPLGARSARRATPRARRKLPI
jgi:hypothetical protein